MEITKKVTIRTITLEAVLTYNNTPILKYSLEYPRFSSDEYSHAIRKMNEYYENSAREYEKYIRTELWESAIEAYKNSIKNGYPIFEFEAMQRYKLTYNRDCVVSLYMDRYEYTGGAHGNTVRQSQTWNVLNGTQIPLKELFPRNPNYISDLKAEINRQIAKQIKQGTGMYFDNYKELVDKTFNSNQFYLTPDALAIYFQQYDIAPYVSGIPTFMIPYDTVHAQLPSCRTLDK